MITFFKYSFFAFSFFSFLLIVIYSFSPFSNSPFFLPDRLRAKNITHGFADNDIGSLYFFSEYFLPFARAQAKETTTADIIEPVVKTVEQQNLELRKYILDLDPLVSNYARLYDSCRFR